MLRIIQAEGIPDAVAHGRDGLVAKGWTPLAKVDFDVAAGAARTTLHVEAVRAAGADPGIIQRRIDDSEDRPRHDEQQEQDPKATPVGPGPAVVQADEDDSRRTLLASPQPNLVQEDADMGDETMAQPVP